MTAPVEYSGAPVPPPARGEPPAAVCGCVSCEVNIRCGCAACEARSDDEPWRDILRGSDALIWLAARNA